jgi:hypothetical protein
MPFPARPAIEKVMPRLTLDANDCWLWEGSTGAGGRGQVWEVRNGKKRLRRTHQVTYEYFRGAVPEGLELDHLCRVPLCANPWHLEAVTHAENVRRGNAPNAIAVRTNACKRGHSLEDAYIQAGARVCRICKIAAARAYRAKNRDAISARRAARKVAESLGVEVMDLSRKPYRRFGG